MRYMKRIKGIYKDIVSIDNCRTAILAAAEKYTRAELQKPHIKDIMDHLEEYTTALHVKLIYGNFTSPYWEKDICDGLSHKMRHIKIPKFFPDQCAHHAIIQVLEPYIMKGAHYWSCSNIPGRGQKRAARGVEQAINRYDMKYCCKLDIRKFYPSINNLKLKAFLRTKIKDRKVLLLLDHLIDTNPQGLPIGNYTSPWLAEWYLQLLDHYILEQLHIKFYVRYADDIVMMDTNKRKLQRAMHKVIEFANDRLDLTIKHNYQVFPIYNCNVYRNGRKIDFIGYCFGKDVTTIRKRRSLKLIQTCRLVKKLDTKHMKLKPHLCSGLMSRSAAFKVSDSAALKEKYFNHLNHKHIKGVIRKESQRLCGLNLSLT